MNQSDSADIKPLFFSRAFRALFSLNMEIALRAREKREWILEQLDVHIAQQRVVPALEDVKYGECFHVGFVREIGRTEIGRFRGAIECIELQQNARHLPFLESLHEQAVSIHTAYVFLSSANAMKLVMWRGRMLPW